MVSVICPIYNEEKYIAQCIESVLAQDYPKEDLEVLFVDGMSSDRTREIVEAYTQQYTFWTIPQQTPKMSGNIQRDVLS